jgi:hypothetical protein
MIFIWRRTDIGNKGKKKWLKSRDINTAYFYRIITHTKKKNLIMSMKIEGATCDSLSTIQFHILDYYMSLFDQRGDKTAFLGQDFWDSQCCLSLNDKEKLECSFTEEELKIVVSH